MARHPFTQDTLEKKTRCLGQIKAFMRKYAIRPTDMSRIIGESDPAVSRWLGGVGAPRICNMESYREKMREYAAAHPLPPKITISEDPLARKIVLKGGGGGSSEVLQQASMFDASLDKTAEVTITGNGLTFKAQISLYQAGIIISSITPKR